MTSLLLQKEKEFHKLNAELEIRTKSLMQEVDSVMNNIVTESKQNQFKSKLSKTNDNSKGGRCEFECSDNWENYEENKQTENSGLNKFFKGRITLLQEELNSVKAENKTKCNELKQIQLDYSKLEDEKHKWYQLSQSYKDQKEKLSSQIAILNSTVQNKDIELSSLRKENDLLKKELKSASMSNTNNETKINKLQEEHEKSKTSLRNAKQEEKELRETHKKQINELKSLNKNLEKQVTELTSGFKKQIMLIDNLKKQKMYLETAKLIQISEDEFSRILDWKPSEDNS